MCSCKLHLKLKLKNSLWKYFPIKIMELWTRAYFSAYFLYLPHIRHLKKKIEEKCQYWHNRSDIFSGNYHTIKRTKALKVNESQYENPTQYQKIEDFPSVIGCEPIVSFKKFFSATFEENVILLPLVHRKIKFLGFHGVVLVKTFPLMYQLLM